MDLIIYAIPFFIILIILELIFQVVQKKKIYRLNDAITNINCGIVQQVTNIFTKSLLFFTYYFLYNHYRLWTIQDTWYSYVILLFLVDFAYYLFHRYSHEIALFWGSHVVHHQSEDYNFSVALRQSATETLISAWFYLPLALLGFNFLSFITVSAIQTLYQFWVHTEVIDRLPRWYEFIFNTPSHHRVHHASDPQYIDKNYGGVFIIYDRIFGTYKEEVEPIHYGITKPVDSWNVLWVNGTYYQKIWTLFWQAKGLDKLRVLFKRTGWKPDYLGGASLPQAKPTGYQKYDAQSDKWMNYYTILLFLFTLGFVSYFLFQYETMSVGVQAVYIVLICWLVFNMGAILEQKSWSAFSEYLRIGGFWGAFLIIHNNENLWINLWAAIVTFLFFIIFLTFSYFHTKNKRPILAE